MRLLRLDLTRYGKFTDYSIDFGTRAPDTPDLHIVYGPNEAGKSTSLAAFLDLLFGIETQSAYNFLHPYQSMQVGGAVELNGAVHELVRVKARQNSLLDAAGQGVDEGILAGALSGISRDAYQTMFSLDDETLEAGGKSILASKGDLGQLLFSASAGLAELSHALMNLRADADNFYKPRARITELSELKRQLGELKEKKDAIDILASTYANLVATREQAGIAYDAAMGERTQAKTRMDEVQRLLDGLPRLKALEKMREQVEHLADLPEPPVEWAAEMASLMQNETRFATQVAGLEAQVERIDAEISTIEIDEPVQALGGRIQGLTAARYMTAEKDLPERRLTLRGLDGEIGSILQRLGQAGHADPFRLVIAAPVVGALRGLIESRSGIGAGLQTSRTEHLRAIDDLAEALRKQDAAGVGLQNEDENVAALARVVREVRGSDHGARQRLADAARMDGLDLLDNRLSTLALRSADVGALLALVGPDSAEIALWRSKLSELGKRFEYQADELERLVTAHRSGEVELAALREAMGAIDDAGAGEARRVRDAAWAMHLSSLDAATAEAFEGMLRHDDEIGAARLRQSTDLARLRQAELALKASAAAIDRADELKRAAGEAYEVLSGQVRAAIAPLFAVAEAVPAEMALVQLESWLKRRGEALEAHRAVQDAEKRLEQARREGQEAQSRLAGALGEAGIRVEKTQNFETLLSMAEDRVDAEAGRRAEAKAARERFEACKADVKIRERDLRRAEEADSDWNAAWTAALERCWLGQSDVVPGVEAVREVLKEVVNLSPALEKRDQLADRIAKMERDEAEFVAEIAALMAELGEVFDAAKVLDHAENLTERAEQARRDHEIRAGKLADRADAERRLQDIAQGLALHDARKAEFTGFFGVDNLHDVSEQLEMVRQRNQQRHRMDELERELVAGLRLDSLADAEAALVELDGPALMAEAAELEGRFRDLDQRAQQLYAARSKAGDEVEAVGGDDAVAKINEQRQTLLLDIEDKALAHLRLRIGALAAEQALRAYRDKHRSSMMERASEAFSTISRGAYSGLAARPEKDNEVLIGLAQGGGSKLATEMSKGTRFQLYLALRVAGYYEFSQSRQPVPFFADDIMETFDDFRAEEAFRLFGAMAEVGQVIYLTHHRHLCDIAKAVCPKARIHDLTALA